MDEDTLVLLLFVGLPALVTAISFYMTYRATGKARAVWAVISGLILIITIISSALVAYMFALGSGMGL